VYCAAVMDAYSRLIVGWSIAEHMRTELVTDALGMAIIRRRPEQRAEDARTILHSDHGSQGGFNWSSQHLDHGGVDGQTSRVDEGVDWPLADEVAGEALASPGRGAAVLG
jgi:putative transposase